MKTVRTPLGSVRGLGSAKSGSHHWWLQRVSSVALIPLSIWLIYSVLNIALGDKAAVTLWLDSPMHALFLALFVGVSCYHGKLGMEVIVEDYVHCHCAKTTLLIANLFGFIVLAAMGIMAIFQLHMM